jgi:pimeloyl-ACP methyl ester carboxylesterase
MSLNEPNFVTGQQDLSTTEPAAQPMEPLSRRATRTLPLLGALALAGCATTPASTTGAATPQTFVLVHDAFADAKAFGAARPPLEARGHRAVVADLPGHGADATALEEITLDAYVESVQALVEAEPKSVVLVGHSMAGMGVARVAERVQAKVRQVVFIAAYLPRSGQSLEELASGDPTSLRRPEHAVRRRRLDRDHQEGRHLLFLARPDAFVTTLLELTTR